MGEFDWFYRNPSRPLKKVCFHQRPFYLVGNFNHLELGTIILIVFDFQGKRTNPQITSTTGFGGSNHLQKNPFRIQTPREFP